jgi:hypothetical protein
MNIPETFYIALCVTILMLGIVYWFWTQVNYLQRKVNLLDNIVYEMKTFISNLPGQSPENTNQPQVIDSDQSGFGNSGNGSDLMNLREEMTFEADPVYRASPESGTDDLETERLASEVEFEPFSGAMPDTNDDLQPGGLATPPVSTSNQSSSDKKISVFSDSAIESPLSSMTIKELRRMAEVNNIPGSADMKKSALIKALRNTVGQIIGQGQEQEQEQGQGQEQGTGPLNVKAGVISFDDIGAPS